MTNHVHLLITPGAPESCTALMRDLGQRYVQYFNRRYQRSGTLWEGRFRSFVAESARYVLACYRYIELNPVRAGMVDRPGAYPWSSHAANSGTRADPLLNEHSEFRALAADEGTRRASYRALFERELDVQLLLVIREAANSGYPLVSQDFRQVIEQLGWKTAPGKPGRRAKARDELQLDPHQTEFGL